jgi:hypothetical protein
MAKKKAKAPKRAPDRPKKNLVVIRGYEEWRDWLNRYAKSRRLEAIALIDMLLAESAQRHGFEPPPERY